MYDDPKVHHCAASNDLCVDFCKCSIHTIDVDLAVQKLCEPDQPTQSIPTPTCIATYTRAALENFDQNTLLPWPNHEKIGLSMFHIKYCRNPLMQKNESG